MQQSCDALGSDDTHTAWRIRRDIEVEEHGTLDEQDALAVTVAITTDAARLFHICPVALDVISSHPDRLPSALALQHPTVSHALYRKLKTAAASRGHPQRSRRMLEDRMTCSDDVADVSSRASYGRRFACILWSVLVRGTTEQVADTSCTATTDATNTTEASFPHWRCSSSICLPSVYQRSAAHSQ